MHSPGVFYLGRSLETPSNINEVEFNALKILAQRQVEDTLQTFPESLGKITRVPVILEKFPSEEDVREGIDTDVLGLFVGPSLAESEMGSAQEAAHILLFLENIWQNSGRNEEMFLEEVKITLLHELGHYLDWNEEDLDRRGLG